MKTLLVNLNAHAMERLGTGLNRVAIVKRGRATRLKAATGKDGFKIYRKGSAGRNGCFVIPSNSAVQLGLESGFRYKLLERTNRDNELLFQCEKEEAIPEKGRPRRKFRFGGPAMSVTARRNGKAPEGEASAPADAASVPKDKKPHRTSRARPMEPVEPPPSFSGEPQDILVEVQAAKKTVTELCKVVTRQGRFIADQSTQIREQSERISELTGHVQSLHALIGNMTGAMMGRINESNSVHQ